jgi:hypothetical protein
LQERLFDLGHHEKRQLGQGVQRNSLTTESFDMDILNMDSFKEKATSQLEQTGTFLTKKQLQAVLRIRIRRIRMFLGLLNSDPDSSSSKNSKKKLDSYCYVTSF